MTGEIHLRPLTVDDAPVMANVLASPALYHYSGGEPPTVDDLERRHIIQTQGGPADGTERWINSIITRGAGRQPIGYVQATVPKEGPTEIAWVVGEPWQGKGYATQAARLLLAELAAEGVVDVIAHIHPDHIASQRIATHLGLTATTTVVDGEIRWEGRLARP